MPQASEITDGYGLFVSVHLVRLRFFFAYRANTVVRKIEIVQEAIVEFTLTSQRGQSGAS